MRFANENDRKNVRKPADIGKVNIFALQSLFIQKMILDKFYSTTNKNVELNFS